jgi:hypothetical protein
MTRQLDIIIWTCRRWKAEVPAPAIWKRRTGEDLIEAHAADHEDIENDEGWEIYFWDSEHFGKDVVRCNGEDLAI